MEYVEYKIDKVRKFRLSLSAQKRIENHFKTSFAKINHENLRVNDLVYMIWACMNEKDRDEVSHDTFFDLLDETLTIKEVYQLFTQITEAAFGKNEETLPEVVIEDPEENGTGTKPFATLSDVV